MIGAMIAKDVWLLLRDRGGLISMFVLPVIFIVAFGLMFRGSGGGAERGKPREVFLYYADGDRRGVDIDKHLASSELFTPKRLPSADAVRAAVAKKDLGAGIVVEPITDTSKPAPDIEIVIDLGTPIQVRGPLQGALFGIVMRAIMPPPASGWNPLLTGNVVVKSPPGIKKPMEGISSFQITVPGNAVLFGFFIAMSVGMAFASERKTGTWRRLLAAPVPRAKALVATLVPYFLIGCVQLAFLFGIGALAFGMEVAGSLGALVVLSLSVIYCAVALGLVFAAVGSTEKQIGGVGSVVLLVMALLGGCMFPRLLMPPFMKQIGLGVPHGWALDGYHDVLVREGTTIADIAPSIGALLAFGTAFALVGIALFRFER